MFGKLTDEILELLWKLREEGSSTVRDVLDRIDDNELLEDLRKMEKIDLIKVSDDIIEFKKKGDARAKDLIRRHRLAERLFHDVLDVGMKESEDTACEIEHILSSSVTDSVCSFLGHPPVCPHGKPIPRGACCAKYKGGHKPLVMQLKDLEVGASGKIVFIIPTDNSRIERLVSMGVVPGSILKLKKKRPSYVFEIDETTLAVDASIVEEIYVKQVQGINLIKKGS